MMSDNISEMNMAGCSLEIETDYVDGSKSEEISISFIDNRVSDDEVPSISFNINRNKARYLYNFLKAFLNEQEPDTP